MNGDTLRNGLIGALACLILGGIAWFFYSHFGFSWDAVPSTSEAAAKNPLLGAERLLERRGYRVQVDQTLSLALFQPLPDGTLILAEGGDSMLATQSQALLAWVARGNTLIVSPGWRQPLFNFARGGVAGKPAKPVKDKAAEEVKDSITAHFGVSLAAPTVQGTLCRNVQSAAAANKAPPKVPQNPRFTYVDCVATLTLPGVAHPLRLDASKSRLVTVAKPDAKDGAAPPSKQAEPDDEDEADPGESSKDMGEAGKQDAKEDGKEDGKAAPQPEASDKVVDQQQPDLSTSDAPAPDVSAPDAPAPDVPTPIAADDDAKAVRIYAHGRGRVAILAEHYFDNYDLAAYDHGELLLGLAALNSHGRNVMLIQRVDIASWASILWHAAPFAICTIAVFLLLWAWSAVRRFGPQLPDPDDRRRALLEHVDASGRWLWKSARGREIMLAAMRRVALRTLSRRIPELRKLAPERQVERIAADGKMGRADLDRALLDAPGRLPIEYTRQIQTLQELRAYYER